MGRVFIYNFILVHPISVILEPLDERPAFSTPYTWEEAH